LTLQEGVLVNGLLLLVHQRLLLQAAVRLIGCAVVIAAMRLFALARQ
jgi:hypothetical protein